MKKIFKKAKNIIIAIFKNIAMFIFSFYLLVVVLALAGAIFYLFMYLDQHINDTKELIGYFLGGIALSIAFTSLLISYSKNFIEDEEKRSIIKLIIDGFLVSTISFLISLIFTLGKGLNYGAWIIYIFVFGATFIFAFCLIFIFIFFLFNFWREWKEFNKKTKHKNSVRS